MQTSNLIVDCNVLIQIKKDLYFLLVKNNNYFWVSKSDKVVKSSNKYFPSKYNSST